MSWKTHLDKVGVVGSFIAAACCLGLPAVLSVVTAIGLGFIVNDAVLLPLLIVFSAITFYGLWFGYRAHRQSGALLLGSVSSLATLFFIFVQTKPFAAYLAIAGLVAASIWNTVLRRKCAPMMQLCYAVSETKAPSVQACPACGQRGKGVEQLTMEHLLRPELTSQMGKTQYYFCEMATCPVVYFPYDSGAAVFQKADLRVRVGLKETVDPIPICYCFDITRKAIWDEIEQTGASTVVSRVKAEVKAGNCACEVKNPSGKCCLGNVTRAVQQGSQQAQASQSFANKAKSVPQT